MLALGIYPKPFTDVDARLGGAICSRTSRRASSERATGHEHPSSLAALPEIVLLGAACAMLVVDLFVSDSQRRHAATG